MTLVEIFACDYQRRVVGSIVVRSICSRSDEIPHRPHRPQIFNILLTSNRTGATVCVYAMNSI